MLLRDPLTVCSERGLPFSLFALTALRGVDLRVEDLGVLLLDIEPSCSRCLTVFVSSCTPGMVEIVLYMYRM